MKLLKSICILVFFLILSDGIFAQRPEFKMPAGRIAISSDGNLHDSDDWGATAFSLAFISYAGLADRFVHYDYNNHLGASRTAWETIMTDAAKGGAKRFGLDVSRVFDDQKQKAEAIANFRKETEKNTAENPLWLICAGPMQMAYEMIEASPADKRQFIFAVSHGTWNEVHVHGACLKTWDDMKKDFPTVTYYDIIDQNKSNDENDFQSHISNWFWLRDSSKPNWQWLYNLDDTHQVDELEKWKSDTKETFDISDAGMTFWLITGGPNGGNDKGGWREIKALFDNPVVSVKGKPGKVKTKKSSGKGLIVIEAESTKSDLGDWKMIKEGDKNYVGNASGKAHLEFLGGTQEGSDPGSPIEYTFKVPEDGNYRLIMQTSKRLEGARGDMCNDVWVKMSGDFQSATNLDVSSLKDYLKYFQDGSVKTPEKSWHWGWRAEKGAHKFFNLVYQLKKGEKYTLTIAGRSQRFSIDYMVLFNENTISFEEAKATAIMMFSGCFMKKQKAEDFANKIQ